MTTRLRYDMLGQRYHSWLVLAHIANGHWLCECVCGQRRDVCGSALRKGASKSCGCQSDAHHIDRVPSISSPEWEPKANMLAAHLFTEPTCTVGLLRWIRRTLHLSGDMARHLLAYGDTVHWWLHTDGKWRCEQELREEPACVTDEYWSAMEAAE